MQFGRYYEEFEVGAVYKHWPGKTVTEYDDHLFCLLTMNHHPLHMDVNYAEKTTDFGKNVVVGNYIYSLLLGMSVPGRLRQGDRQPGGRVAPARRPDLPRRHDLRRDHGPRQDRVEVQGRPRDRPRRDHRLQAGRHDRLHLPPQGHGAQALLRRGPRWRAARPSGAHSALTAAAAVSRDGSAGQHAPPAQGLDQPRACTPARPGRRRRRTRRRRRRPRPPAPRPGATSVQARSSDVVHDAVRRGSAPGPTGAPARTARPVSSRTSRSTACSGVSPASTRPPGSDHSPRCGSWPRRTSSSRPAASCTTAPTHGTTGSESPSGVPAGSMRGRLRSTHPQHAARARRGSVGTRLTIPPRHRTVMPDERVAGLPPLR